MKLEIIISDDGFELHTPQGAARYDVSGLRTSASEKPDCFPARISLDDQRSKPEESVPPVYIGVNTETEEQKAERIKKIVEKTGSLPYGR